MFLGNLVQVTSFLCSFCVVAEADVQGPDGAHVAKLCFSSAELESGIFKSQGKCVILT